MKKTIFSLVVMTLLSLGSSAQLKKDGTPDMRYKANKQTYSAPVQSKPSKQRNYPNGGQYRVQNGYRKSNGTYVSPHIKTTPDNYKYNNYKRKK